MRNVSKNKFLHCFRPVVDIDAMLEPRPAVDRSPSRRFACISVSENDEMGNSHTKSVFNDKGCPEFAEDSIMHQPSKRTLAWVIKAVVFETILNRRVRHKNRYPQDSHGSKRSTNTETSSTGDEKSIFSLVSGKTSIQENSSSSCSSPVSGSKNLPNPYSTKAKKRASGYQNPLEKQKMFNCSGMYLLLISLTLTVLLGKLGGIILTLTWLCILPLWEASCPWKREVAKLWKSESKVYNRNNGRSAGKEPHKGH